MCVIFLKTGLRRDFPIEISCDRSLLFKVMMVFYFNPVYMGNERFTIEVNSNIFPENHEPNG